MGTAEDAPFRLPLLRAATFAILSHEQKHF